MDLKPAGAAAVLDRYIGYWKPYATSHDDLDHEEALQEVKLAARTLADKIVEMRTGRALIDRQKPPREK